MARRSCLDVELFGRCQRDKGSVRVDGSSVRIERRRTYVALEARAVERCGLRPSHGGPLPRVDRHSRAAPSEGRRHCGGHDRDWAGRFVDEAADRDESQRRRHLDRDDEGPRGRRLDRPDGGFRARCKEPPSGQRILHHPVWPHPHPTSFPGILVGDQIARSIPGHLRPVLVSRPEEQLPVRRVEQLTVARDPSAEHVGRAIRSRPPINACPGDQMLLGRSRHGQIERFELRDSNRGLVEHLAGRGDPQGKDAGREVSPLWIDRPSDEVLGAIPGNAQTRMHQVLPCNERQSAWIEHAALRRDATGEEDLGLGAATISNRRLRWRARPDDHRVCAITGRRECDAIVQSCIAGRHSMSDRLGDRVQSLAVVPQAVRPNPRASDVGPQPEHEVPTASEDRNRAHHGARGRSDGSNVAAKRRSQSDGRGKSLGRVLMLLPLIGNTRGEHGQAREPGCPPCATTECTQHEVDGSEWLSIRPMYAPVVVRPSGWPMAVHRQLDAMNTRHRSPDRRRRDSQFRLHVHPR